VVGFSACHLAGPTSTGFDTRTCLVRIFATDCGSADLPSRTIVSLHSCGLLKKVISIADMLVSVADKNLFQKLRIRSCGSPSFKLRSCDYGLKKWAQPLLERNETVVKKMIKIQSVSGWTGAGSDRGRYGPCKWFFIFLLSLYYI
jgi:hypothetical protein